jgi:hypothetical protein
MFWYIKEMGWYYEKLHGPFNSKEDAINNKPKDLKNGRLESQVTFKVFETEDLL